MSKEGQLIRGEKYSRMMDAAAASSSKEALSELKWLKSQPSIRSDIELYNSSKTKSKGSK